MEDRNINLPNLNLLGCSSIWHFSFCLTCCPHQLKCKYIPYCVVCIFILHGFACWSHLGLVWKVLDWSGMRGTGGEINLILDSFSPFHFNPLLSKQALLKFFHEPMTLRHVYTQFLLHGRMNYYHIHIGIAACSILTLPFEIIRFMLSDHYVWEDLDVFMHTWLSPLLLH